MTITITKRLIRQSGNDATTVWPYDFYIPTADDVEVSTYNNSTGVTTVLSPSSYTITGLGDEAFGSVTYPLSGDPLATGIDIIIKRIVSYTQTVDISSQGSYDPSVLEAALDKIVMQIQQVKEEQGRNLAVPAGEEGVELPSATARANKFLMFDADGDPTVSTVVDVGELAVPGASTDNEILIWDGTAADTVQTSGVTIDPSTKDIAGLRHIVLSGALKAAKGVDVASANVLTLGSDGWYFDITGTTTITSIGTLGVGTLVCLHFDGVLTLTHHATDLILPNAANITTAAGDEALFVEYATGAWRCISYFPPPGYAKLGANTFTGTQTFGDNLLTGAYLTDYAEKVNAVGSIGGGAWEVSYTDGQIVTATVDTSTTTLSIINWPASGREGSMTFYLTNGGSQTFNWPAGIIWPGGVAPSLAASGEDVITLTSRDGGTTIYGFPAGMDMS